MNKEDIIRILIQSINSSYRPDSGLSKAVEKSLRKLSISELDQLSVLIGTRKN